MKNFLKTFRNLFDRLILLESKFVKKKSSNKKILVIRLDGLGDFILFAPTLKYYKEIYKDYSFTLILSEICKDFVGRFSCIDEYIVFDRKRFSTDLAYRRHFFLDIARRGFDVAVYPVFSRQHIGDLMIAFSGARERIGFDGSDYIISKEQRLANNPYYTRLIKLPNDNFSEVNKNAFFIKELGANTGDEVLPKFELNNADRENSRNILTGLGLVDKKYCFVFPGAGATYRVWPSERYSVVLSGLVDRGIIPVVIGDTSDEKMIESIMLKTKNGAIKITEHIDVPTLAAMLGSAVFYLGSETGMMHLAAAVNTPVVCLIGGGHFGRFFPYGDANINRAVYDKNMKCMKDNWQCAIGLKNNEPAPCIDGIKVEDVNREIDLLLNYIK